ncbi:MAG: Fic family protein [Phycisphaerae bacterium]|nr:Fic family protein [Phycisphaerae bacterium]
MDPKLFHSSATGRVVKTVAGFWAFIPAAPPTVIEYDTKLVSLLSQADAALSELSGLGRIMPNPDLLIAPYVRREAVASSRIEGTRADLSDLLLDEIEPTRTPRGSDVYEIRNYVAALNLGIRRLPKLPLAGRLIKQMHAVLLAGVRGEHLAPGEYRRTPNWIGPPGSTLLTASYVPPPPTEMHECLKDWEQFANDRSGKLPDLIQVAILHEHFESIHPFLDGNGRIGRLLITLFLMERDRLSKPLLYLSSYIESHKSEYYELLQRIRTDGDLRSWLLYFLTAVRDTARSAIKQSQTIFEVRERYRAKLDKRHRALSLLDALFVNPYTTVARAASTLGVTSPTAQKTIDQLVEAKMLREATGREWGRYWLAQPILDVVNSPLS